MRRWLFRSVSFLSLLLFAATAAFAIRAQFAADSWWIRVGQTVIELESDCHHVVLWRLSSDVNYEQGVHHLQTEPRSADVSWLQVQCRTIAGILVSQTLSYI